LFIPSIGLGLAQLMLAVKERQFLPFLDKASGAMTAIEGRPSDKETPEPGPPAAGGPLGGILGSAVTIGNMVPTAERMATVARAVLAILLLGLAYLLVLVPAGLLLGSFTISLMAAELAVFALFVGPAVALFGRLSRDLEFYRYYSRRHRALTEMAALGPPPVPAGLDHLARFDRFLRSVPAGKRLLAAPGSGIEDLPAGGPYNRLYRGAVDGVPSGIIVKVFREMPAAAGLAGFLADSRAAGNEKGLAISRAIALVAADVDDIDDALYEHVIELGKRTASGETALQLVMEVGGAYSMVPYISS
jgi:hypothetical protein